MPKTHAWTAKPPLHDLASMPRILNVGRRLSSVSCAALLIWTAPVDMAQAQSEWLGDFNSDWNIGENWLGGVPSAGSLATIDGDRHAAILSGSIGAATSLEIGFESSGEARVEDRGSLNVNSLILGVNAGGDGRLVVTEEGSEFIFDFFTIIGRMGRGEMIISDGGQASTSGVVDMAGFPGAEGRLTVTGQGSRLTIQERLLVGQRGVGRVEIADGGYVRSRSGLIGFNEDSQGGVIVSGTGSHWEIGETLEVGRDGEAALVLQNGGRVTSGTTRVGIGGASSGTIHIGGVTTDAPAAPGVLDTPSITFGDGQARLAFNHTGSAYVFAPDILGDGVIDHLSGTTFLTGNSNGFSGTTAITGGRLSVAGALGGQTFVAPGGLLRGRGTLGSIDVFGTLAPGNSVGTMTSTGDVTFNPGSTFQIFVDETGASRLNAGGTAEILGGNVNVVSLLADGDGRILGTYTILEADERQGEFEGVTANYAFLLPTLAYDTSSVFLTLALPPGEGPVSLTELAKPFARTANQNALVGTLHTLDVDDPRYDDFFDTFISLADSDVAPSLEALSGSRLAGGVMLALPAASELVDIIQALDGVSGQPGVLNGRGSWAQISGLIGNQRSRDGKPGSDTRSFGVQAGLEARVGDATTVGAAFGYQDARVSSGALSRIDSEILSLALYARHEVDGFRLSGAVGYSTLDSESTRMLGQFGTQAAEFDAYLWIADAAIAYDWAAATPGLTFSPLAGLRYASLRQDAFTEEGPAGLEFGTFRSDTLRARLGVEVSYDMETEQGTSLSLGAQATWSREIGSPNTTMQAALLGGEPFDVRGQGLPRDILTAGVSVQAEMTDTFRLSAGYSGSFGSGFDDHRIQAGAEITW